MLQEGPIPAAVHGLVEYAAAALFIVAPFLLGFDSAPATALSIVVGVLVVVVAATTVGPTSLVNRLPVRVHVALDVALALFLIGAPFVFGYSDEGPPTAFFIVLGVAHLLITIGTRFSPAAGQLR